MDYAMRAVNEKQESGYPDRFGHSEDDDRKRAVLNGGDKMIIEIRGLPGVIKDK